MTHVHSRRLALAAAWLSLAACQPGDASPITQSPTGPTPPQQVQPPPSAGHNLVYADELEMVLLVNAGLGGMTNPAATTRTRIWGWTGDRWRVIDSAGPPVRNLAGVAYDARRRTLVMHGGSYDLPRTYGETWEWTPTSGWRQFQFSGAGPGTRDHTQMTYDVNRGRVVLFGGQANETTPLGDTWEFDGTRWQRVATTGPAARVHHAMQYDPALGQVVLFGGIAPGSGGLGDTWAWDGTAWRALGASIAPRTHARMAYHRRLQSLLILGGFEQSSSMTVLQRGATWSPLTGSGAPNARYLLDAAYDVKRDVLVLFGGGDPNGSSLFADTWELDGTVWRKKS